MRSRENQRKQFLAASPQLPLVVLLAIFLPTALTSFAQAQNASVFHYYDFQGVPDGASPQSTLNRDAAGNLYGTTSQGGAFGFGTVFKITRDGMESVFYSFTNGSDGRNPYGGLVGDSTGNLYGTTNGGGDVFCGLSSGGCGVVFKLDPSGSLTVLHTFTGGPDGAFPEATLVRDVAGNLYGITDGGGTHGLGAVFKLDATGREVMRYSFVGPPNDGANPSGKLVRDGRGNLYGTTSSGGSLNLGTVFKISNTGAETMLYGFVGQSDGATPRGGLVRNSNNLLYGTAQLGGVFDQGVVFSINEAGKENIVYTFTGFADGGTPYSGLISDAAGNLYGTTLAGTISGCGAIFKATIFGGESILHTFGTSEDPGCSPTAGLSLDAAGDLYGTTASGGSQNSGTAFRFTP